MNWNGRDLLEKFLPEVISFSPGAAIYVVDNASTDDSAALVETRFKEVQLIRNSENYGFAEGYNRALKNLSEDIFVLLNSDVQVTENWLEPVLREFEKDPLVVAAQPKIRDYHNRSCFEYAGAAGGFLDRYGFPFCRGRIFDILEKDSGQYDETSPVFWASGACFFVRRDAFFRAGGFDEDYFAHQEEIDLCWRLQIHGGKIIAVGTSKVFHIGGASLSAANPAKTFYNFRNSLFTLLKNQKGTGIYGVIFVRLVMDGLAGLRFLFSGKASHCFAIVKAHFSFYYFLPKFLKKRSEKAASLKYFHIKSIVFQHFILKKKYFNQL